MPLNHQMKVWTARVRSLAIDCKFGDELQVVFRDRFIMGLEKAPVRDRLFEEGKEKSFFEAVRIALSKEASSCKPEVTAAQVSTARKYIIKDVIAETHVIINLVTLFCLW
ncbi:hypothetical protein HHI36_017505 [Cryptolaemus montrouzieri]|uniref:Uncharacterized protein n=1 Tax=Cryptolaemus montrouzieri TaxID=559131 RepID=A0ABD2NMR2_9CUCU